MSGLEWMLVGLLCVAVAEIEIVVMGWVAHKALNRNDVLISMLKEESK